MDAADSPIYFALHTEHGVTHDSASSWQSSAPLLDAALRFNAAARTYLEESAQGAAAAARTFSDSLREQWMPLFQLGAASFGDGAVHGVPPGATLEMPALGLTREHQLRAQRTAATARRMADAQLRLQLLWSDALRSAALAFVAHIDRSHSSGDAATAAGAATLHGLYAAWIDCAEEAYARVAHSDSFCCALADFVNAGSQWRMEVQASMEHWAKSVDLPTRSEVDTLTRRLRSVEELLRSRDVARPASADRKARASSRARAGTHGHGRRTPRGPKP